ncbi:MAG: nickel pincer cofactor biosynthesis protein LarC [Candidatus Lokiarchaeota archaeon]|nr:nickel pincer cofactor biosynthesis protein LarC [Candidatus Lokiarchaeota archaeon]
MKILYIDTSNSGMSGDMLLAGLLGLIENPDELVNELNEISKFISGIVNFKVNLAKVRRSGIEAYQLEVTINEKKDHRSTKTLKEALNAFMEEKKYSMNATNYANNVLDSLITAEADVHGKLAEEIHLHELSSIDTLLDILGVTRVLEILGVFRKEVEISISNLPLGGGTVKTAHGILPVPAPATSKIIENSGISVHFGPIDNELTTPTGAALLRNLTFTCEKPHMTVEKSSFSTGQKTFTNFPNLFRIFYGESLTNNLEKYIEKIEIIETDVDDVSGEVIGHLMKRLESENVLDVQIIPAWTKKRRPSNIIKVLCSPEHKFEIINILLDELGTLGVRFTTFDRVCVERIYENIEIEINGTNYPIRYKISYIKTLDQKQLVNIKPEYEDLNKISDLTGLSLKKVQMFAQEKLKYFYQKLIKEM